MADSHDDFLRDPLEVPDSPSRPNDADDRRLWFDYIHALNERQLQDSQRSGVTTYVLLATLVALVYRFGPHLPQFLARAGSVKASVTIFVLLVVGFVNLAATVSLLGRYLAGEDEFRAAPKSSQALLTFVYGCIALVAMAFASLETWVAISSLDRFRKYVLIGHAVFVVANAISPLIQHGRKARKTAKFRDLLPYFGLYRAHPTVNLIALAFPLAWSVLVAICLLRYVGSLPDYGLEPFKGAGIVLVAVWILAYLVLRNFADAGRQKYFGLERDIVLNKMTPSEIRDRYLRDLSGPDMAQWLDDALGRLDLKEKHVQHEQESAQETLEEIAKIDPGYHAERRERARPVAERLRRAVDECLSQYEALNFQTGFSINNYMTEEEQNILRQRFRVFNERLRALRERLEPARAVLIELSKLTEHESSPPPES